MLRNGAATAMFSTAATSSAARLPANPRNTKAASPSLSTLSAGSRQLSRSRNPRSPQWDLAQRRGVLARAGEHVIDIGSGNDETGAEADQLALPGDVVADAADAQHLAVYPAGLCHALIGFAQARVIDLAGDAVVGGQIARADQQHIDPGQCGNCLGVVDAFRSLQH